MAFGDPLVMDAVLSMGGFPLTTNERIDSIESQRMHHYGKALKGLKLSLTSWNEKRSEDPLRLLLTTVFLCQSFVAIHRVSLATISPPADRTGSLHIKYDSDNPKSGACIARNASESALESLFGLRLIPHFGTLLGSSAQLYEMIPNIRRLASDRAKELSLGIDCGCAATFNVLHEQLVAFDWGTALETGPASQMEAYLCGKAAAGKLVQNALVLFLLSAYSPNDPAPVRVMASPLVDSTLEAASIISTSPWRNPVFWPIVVIASYACTDQQREKVLELMWPRIALISRAREALQWLWESPDNLYGLDGLATVFKDHDANYCFGYSELS
uniref:Uncharacterized protein n=1 Tax=Bionectria ochroleuca TaxID=29856 RepID=A0A8H7N6F7_BIOOC